MEWRCYLLLSLRSEEIEEQAIQILNYVIVVTLMLNVNYMLKFIVTAYLVPGVKYYM